MERKKCLFKLIIAVLIVITSFTTCETSPQQQTNLTTRQQTGVLSQEAIKPDFWIGDGGKGEGITIFQINSQGITGNDQDIIPELIRGVLIEAFDRFTAMRVLDRVELANMIMEGESDFYADENEIIRMGQVTDTKYQLRGDIIGTGAGYNVRLTVWDATTASSRATYNENLQRNEIEDLSGIRLASSNILAQMGIQLTSAGQQALVRSASDNEIHARTALARGINAQMQGTEVAAFSYFLMARAFDPSLTEAINNSIILHANITGNVGMNIREDIRWFNQWEERLKETEQFFHTFFLSESLPYTFFYVSDIKRGDIDVRAGTANLHIPGTYFHAHRIWINTIEETLQAIYDGLHITGRAAAWKLQNWPRESVTNLNTFANHRTNFHVVFELVNEKNMVIARTTAELQSSWELSGGRPIINIGTNYDYSVNSDGTVRSTELIFRNVNANYISDSMTIRVAGINGAEPEIAVRNSVIQICPIHHLDFIEIARFKFSRGEIRGFVNHSTNTGRLLIPETIWGDRVTTIGEKAFTGTGITSLHIPGSVSSIGNNAFENNRLTSVIIPNGVLSIGNEAFNNNPLRTVTIPDNTSVGKRVFTLYWTTEFRINIGQSVSLLPESFLFFQPRTQNFIDGWTAFQNFYNRKGAGTYTINTFGIWKHTPYEK